MRSFLFLALLSSASASPGLFASGTDDAETGVTPINKVIQLVVGIQKEVELESKEEAAVYDKFACFCKDTTMQKSKSVNDGKRNIDKLSAKIEDETAQQKEAETELQRRKRKQEQLKKDLQETKNRCAKEKATYEAAAADLNKAMADLKNAIKALQDSKPADFLQVKASLRKTFELADAMNLISTPKHKKVFAFIQTTTGVDPADPEYQFHSDDIIEICQDLLKEYTENKDDLDEEWGKTSKACKEKIESLTKEIEANLAAMKALTKKIAELKQSIAEAREDLVMAQGQMEDDALYLKDLTKRCQDRSHDYDQRSAMRANELEAIATALGILEGKVKTTADEVNVRALVQTGTQAGKPNLRAGKTVQKAISFLQSSSVSSTEEINKQKALAVLRGEGKRLKSLTLLSLVQRAAADPFAKVKVLIQRLIERLLTEAKNEATKKGFCDTELGKAELDRNFRWEEANDLSAELKVLEATRDRLKHDNGQLKKEVDQQVKTLKYATRDRKDEKEINQETIRTAKEGLAACTEAYAILKKFYKQAAKAGLSLLQASPVDEDTDGPGFKGNYAGKQSGMKAVFALLETIISDFERTLAVTGEEEHHANRDFVGFDQQSKSSTAGKNTKRDLNGQDLETVEATIETKFADLQTAQDLLDKALQEIAELKPTCIDTGMSYAERVKKRDEEIAALKKAKIILMPEGPEVLG
jgi:hypothetical protein